VGDSPVPRLPVTGGASARSCPAERWRRLRPAGSKIGAADPEDPVHGRMSGCRRPAKVASCWRRARFSRTRHVWSAWPRGASAGEPRGVESSSRGGPRPWGESSIVPVRLDLWRETGPPLRDSTALADFLFPFSTVTAATPTWHSSIDPRPPRRGPGTFVGMFGGRTWAKKWRRRPVCEAAWPGAKRGWRTARRPSRVGFESVHEGARSVDPKWESAVLLAAAMVGNIRVLS